MSRNTSWGFARFRGIAKTAHTPLSCRHHPPTHILHYHRRWHRIVVISFYPTNLTLRCWPSSFRDKPLSHWWDFPSSAWFPWFRHSTYVPQREQILQLRGRVRFDVSNIRVSSKGLRFSPNCSLALLLLSFIAPGYYRLLELVQHFLQVHDRGSHLFRPRRHHRSRVSFIWWPSIGNSRIKLFSVNQVAQWYQKQHSQNLVIGDDYDNAKVFRHFLTCKLSCIFLGLWSQLH